MRFSTEDTSSSFQSNLTKIETYQTDLGTFETSINGDLTGAQGFIDSVDLGDWSDQVQTKFSSFIDNSLKKGVTSMTDDITGGSFNTLKTTVDSLHTSVQTCYNKKKQIETKTLQLDRTPEYVEVQIPNPTPSYMTDLSSPDDDYITAKEKNSAYTQLQSEIKTLKGELATAVGEANGYLNTISTITFDPDDTSGGAGNNSSPGDKGDDSGKDGDKSGDKDGGKDEKTGGKARGGTDETPSGKQEDGSTVVRYGDTVTIGNKAVVYVGTTENGTNLYKDPNTDKVLYVDKDGNLQESNGTVQSLYNNGINAGGEIVYPGDFTYERKYEKGEEMPFRFQTDGNTGVRKGKARGEETPVAPSQQPANPAPTPEVNVVTGDTVKVQGKSAVYLGTTDKGINIFKDPTNDLIYYQVNGGDLIQSNADYTSYINYGANINGEVLYYGDMSDSAHYSDGSQAPFTYISSGGNEGYNTYEYGEDSQDA